MEQLKSVRLYYTNSYQTNFDASIVKVLPANEKQAGKQTGKQIIVLDQTAFYPTSGGQAHDTGTLAGSPVVDVIAGEDGSVQHLLAEEFPAQVGERVHGEIDWLRRYDHMQQHSGQHLLSHLFHTLFGFETVSVHFGAEESTLDLQIDAISPEQLAAAERRANELVYANLSLTAYFVDDNMVRTLPLRRPPKVQGEIRIVEMEGLDWVACGGTHCRRTGELGPIKLVRQERSRGNLRVTFLCGWRAQADYGTKHELLSRVAGTFSTDAAEIPAAIERLQESERRLQQEVAQLQGVVRQAQAAELLEQAQSLGDYQFVAYVYTDENTNENIAADVGSVKQVAQQLQQEPRVVAALGVVVGELLTVFVAVGADVPLNAGQILRSALEPFGGRGGGRPEFAQGGGLAAASASPFLERIRALVNTALL